jgi:hypothetical protein
MRKDQRHLVLSLALAGTVLASAAAAPVLALVPAVQRPDGSAYLKIAPANTQANAAAFWKWGPST